MDQLVHGVGAVCVAESGLEWALAYLTHAIRGWDYTQLAKVLSTPGRAWGGVRQPRQGEAGTSAGTRLPGIPHEDRSASHGAKPPCPLCVDGWQQHRRLARLGGVASPHRRHSPGCRCRTVRSRQTHHRDHRRGTGIDQCAAGARTPRGHFPRILTIVTCLTCANIAPSGVARERSFASQLSGGMTPTRLAAAGLQFQHVPEEPDSAQRGGRAFLARAGRGLERAGVVPKECCAKWRSETGPHRCVQRQGGRSLDGSSRSCRASANGTPSRTEAHSAGHRRLRCPPPQRR